MPLNKTKQNKTKQNKTKQNKQTESVRKVLSKQGWILKFLLCSLKVVTKVQKQWQKTLLTSEHYIHILRSNSWIWEILLMISL